MSMDFLPLGENGADVPVDRSHEEPATQGGLAKGPSDTPPPTPAQ